MAIDNFSFNPADGLRNKSVYPTDPATEDEAREQVQGRFDEVKNYINGKLVSGVNSHLADLVKVMGSGIENLVKNGDFSQGTAGWTANASTHSVSNNILSNKATGSSSWSSESYLTAVPSFAGHKIFIKATIKVPAECTKINLYTYNGINNKYGVSIYPTIFGQFVTYCGICPEQTEIGSRNIELYLTHLYSDAATAKDKVMEAKEVIAIDLTTAFGAGNEPTAEEMDKLLQYYPEVLKFNNVGDIALKASKVQEAWITPTLQNGWIESFPIRYRKNQFGNIEFRGVITGGTVTVNTVLFSLPADYRPTQNQRVSCISYFSNNSKSQVIGVDAASGAVTILINDALGFISFDGVGMKV